MPAIIVSPAGEAALTLTPRLVEWTLPVTVGFIASSISLIRLAKDSISSTLKHAINAGKKDTAAPAAPAYPAYPPAPYPAYPPPPPYPGLPAYPANPAYPAYPANPALPGQNHQTQPRDVQAQSVVRIVVGLDMEESTGEGLTGAGGHLPTVRLWNEALEFLGWNSKPTKVQGGGDKIEDGTSAHFLVNHDANNAQQAAYTLFSAREDSICIAYAGILWPDDNEYGWLGDWGKACGHKWYWSNYTVEGTQHSPPCMWIGSKLPQGYPTGFQVHWTDFYVEPGKVPDNSTVDYLCSGSRAFNVRYGRQPAELLKIEVDKDSLKPTHSDPSLFNATDNLWSGGARVRRSLVHSKDAEHQTEELCKSEHSYGPDFVNHEEGLFCRMSDKTLWPLCTDDVTDNCFNVEANGLVTNGVLPRAPLYDNVISWL